MCSKTCPRWAVSGGDIYGNSPGMEALGDIKQLQHEQLRKAQGIDYQTNPPLQVPTSMKNRDVERLPGGVTYVDFAGGSQGVKTAFEVNLNLQYLLQDIQDVRQRVQGSFYADLFLMLANQADARMTATEVAERHEEKLLMLGPVLERLQNELLDPLIEFTFDAIMESGMMPPPPYTVPNSIPGVEALSELSSMTPVIRPPRHLANEQLSFTTDSGKVVPDPTIYSEWFDRAPARLRRKAVGSGRYADAVAAAGGDGAVGRGGRHAACRRYGLGWLPKVTVRVASDQRELPTPLRDLVFARAASRAPTCCRFSSGVRARVEA
mgnify:CR=1 FL=1